MLLERDRELGELGAALDRVVGGTGCAVGIEAGAGLGKTSLLQEIRVAAEEADLTVLKARASELEKDFSFALVGQLFASEFAGLPSDERERVLEGASAARSALGLDRGEDRDQDTFAVLHALYWVTAALADRKPLLLAIDDVHWIDSGSLDYINFLLPRLEELPVLLVITLRPDEPGLPPDLSRTLTDPNLRHLTLAPLSPEGSSAMLSQELAQESSPGFSSLCHEVSGGNPFLLCELVRNLVEQGIAPTAEGAKWVQQEVPARVAHMVLIRIAGLRPMAAEVARSLAVLGDGADHGLLAAMDGTTAEETEEAADELRASAIFDHGPVPRFIHPLVGNAVYSEMSVGERSRSHARAAALLRKREAGSERVATQLLATEPRGEVETVEVLAEAGRQALSAGAPRSAIAYLSRALREPPPAELRAEVLDPLLTASFRAADQAAFAAVEDDVLAEWDRNPTIRPRWANKLIMVMALGGRFEQGVSMLGEAIEVASSEGDFERAYQLQAQLSTVAAVSPGVTEVGAIDHSGRIDPESPAGRLAAAMDLRAVAMSGSAEEVADAANRALANDCSIFAEAPELMAAPISVMTLVIADHLDDARHGAERALAIAHERGATPELVTAHFLNGFVAWGYGDFPTAEADMRQSIDLARLASIVPLVLTYVGPLIDVLIERDELDEAEAQLQATGMADGPMPDNILFNILLMMRGRLRFEQGEQERAAEDFENLAKRGTEMGLGIGTMMAICPFAVQSLMALDRTAQARRLADEMAVFCRNFGALSGISHITRGVAASRGGAEAIELLEEAVAAGRASPKPMAPANALYDLGDALRRSGRRSEARAPLREAFETARRCGAARLAKKANAALGATGESVRRYTPIGVESLTPSERRVADLAASGLTNRQVAQSLFVTVKTVEAHLSASYHKLDIRSRAELPGALEKA